LADRRLFEIHANAFDMTILPADTSRREYVMGEFHVTTTNRYRPAIIAAGSA